MRRKFTPWHSITTARLLASADSANAVRLWDMERHRAVNVLPEQGNEIRCLAFSPDGQILVSGGADRVLHVWDARHQRDEDTMSDSLLSRTALAVRADGKQLASLGAGTSLRVWDTTSGDSVLSLENARVLRTFAASADGAWFAASLADEDAPLETATLGLWDVATGKRQRLLEGPKPPITTLAFAPDSTRLASSGHQTTDVWLWQIPSGQPILLIPNATNSCSVEGLAWHPQGRLLACRRHRLAIHQRQRRSGDLVGRSPRHTDRLIPGRRDGSGLSSVGQEAGRDDTQAQGARLGDRQQPGNPAGARN